MKQNNSLVLVKTKKKGRSYIFTGQPINKPWMLKDITTDKIYDTYEEYQEEQEQIKKKKDFADKMKKGKAEAAKKKEAAKQDKEQDKE